MNQIHFVLGLAFISRKQEDKPTCVFNFCQTHPPPLLYSLIGQFSLYPRIPWGKSCMSEYNESCKLGIQHNIQYTK